MRPVLRSVLGVLGGYVVMVVVVAGFNTVMRMAGAQAATYLIASLLYSFAAAVAGGFAAGWFAGRAPAAHALALAVLALLVSLARFAGVSRPVWYQGAILAGMPVGALLGGYLSARLRTVSAARASSR